MVPGKENIPEEENAAVETLVDVVEPPVEAVETSVDAVELSVKVAKPAKAKIRKPKIRKPKTVKPKPVVPAGPMLEKPAPAKLTGPNVVRVEAVETVEIKPRRQSPPKRKYDKQIAEPLMMTGPAKLSTPAKGRKAGKQKTQGRRKDHGQQEDAKPSRISERRMRARDLEERQARLAAARGESLRSRPSRKIETQKSGGAGHVERPEKANVSEPITVKDLSAAIDEHL